MLVAINIYYIDGVVLCDGARQITTKFSDQARHDEGLGYPVAGAGRGESAIDARIF